MLNVQALCAHYGSSQALFDLSLIVGEGEVVALLGRNGMGKSTTVHTIMGIVKASAGTIEFEKQRIDRLRPYQIARSGLGLVPEGRQVFPNLTVAENLVATAANRHRRAQPWTVDSVLKLFPALAQRRQHMGNLLSGGEQQMLAIARALLTNPKLLLLDEVTEGLAPLIRQEIWAVLAELKRAGHAILVIDKNLDELSKIADRHYVIEKGRTVWSGDGNRLHSDEQTLKQYLSV